MKNELMTALNVVAEKLKNSNFDECSLSLLVCRYRSELKILANIWKLSEEEVLILTAVIIRNTERIFEQCTFTNIAQELGITNLELIGNYHLLQNLEEGGFIRTETLQMDQLTVRPGVRLQAVQTAIPELGHRYLLGESVFVALLNKN